MFGIVVDNHIYADATKNSRRLEDIDISQFSFLEIFGQSYGEQYQMMPFDREYLHIQSIVSTVELALTDSEILTHQMFHFKNGITANVVLGDLDLSDVICWRIPTTLKSFYTICSSSHRF